VLDGQRGPLHATRLLNVFENVCQPVVRDGLRNSEGSVLLYELVYEPLHVSDVIVWPVLNRQTAQRLDGKG
jgi:hypothetical protein